MSAYGQGPYGQGAYGGATATTTPTGTTPTVVSATGITVLADVASKPPRFEITISTPDGTVMDAVTLTRTSGGVTIPTRVQPLTGFAARAISDYEAGWETPTVYTATITAGGVTTVCPSPAVQLAPSAAWLVHPTTPALSFCVDRRDPTVTQILDVAATVRAGTSTKHPILGAAYPVVTTLGARSASTTTFTVLTTTLVDEANLWAALNDETPLLVQVPPSWGWGFEGGYWSIDDAASDRAGGGPANPLRIFTLPGTRVDAPAGVQQATWSYADLLEAFPDYPAAQAAYADYPSLLADIRK